MGNTDEDLRTFMHPFLAQRNKYLSVQKEFRSRL
jgi:hypothetical protein